MDGRDIAIFAVAAFVAVTSLVRLMIGRRNAVTAQLQAQAKHRKKSDKKQPNPAKAPHRP